MCPLGWLAHVAFGIALFAASACAPAAAQVRVDAETEVSTVRFSGERAIAEPKLRAVIKTQARSFAYGLGVALGKLPFVSPPAPRYFSPIELQRDVVRLRHYYVGAGFVDAKVDYQVRHDEARNLIDIEFVIDERDPWRISAASVVGPDSVTPLRVADGLRRRWHSVETSIERMRGRRLDVELLGERGRRIRGWWQDHGHPSPAVRLVLDGDTLRHQTSIRYVVSPGAPARFGPITIAGEPSISATTIRRELPFRAGDTYSSARLEEGRRQLQELEIIRAASFDVTTPDSQQQASMPVPDVPVAVHLYEAKRRHVGGDFGYGSDIGLAVEGRWGHRNFFGSGRALTVSAGAQTGVLAFEKNPDEVYRGAVSLLQPYLFHRRLSGVLSPFIEYRDDIRDRSREFGTNATLVVRAGQNGTASLDYRIAKRRIYEYHLDDLASGNVDFLTLLALASQGFLDSLGTTLYTSALTLSAKVSTLDQPGNPRLGLLVQPSVQVTTPIGVSSTEYWLLDGAMHGFVPLTSWAVLAGRVGVGRVLPFGRSVPREGEGLLRFLQLSDVLQVAGGSEDVRGWAHRLLGPKVPDIRFQTVGDSLTVVAEGYTPVGGLSRTTFSFELRMPFPGLGSQFGSFVFLDGGRVWTSDSRFTGNEAPSSDERWFYAAGGGLDLRTPVGPIRLSVGYKLNPSVTDLVNANDYYQALVQDLPLDDLKQYNSRRWQIHLAIGQGF